MTAEIGTYGLILGMLVSAVTALLGLIGAHRRDPNLMAMASYGMMVSVRPGGTGLCRVDLGLCDERFLAGGGGCQFQHGDAASVPGDGRLGQS